MNNDEPYDPTDVKCLSNALYCACARLAAAEAISQNAMVSIRLNGQIYSWNLAAVKMFGYTADEIIGQNIHVLAQLGKHVEQDEFIASAYGKENSKPVDLMMLHKNHSLIDASATATPLKARDGAIFGVALNMQDVGRQKEWERRQRLMTRELSHRVKNSFAVLQSILHSTLKATPEPEEFAKVFSGRMHSLASSQDVLTANDWKGVELGALAKHQLAAYDRLDDVKLSIAGPEIYLAPHFASPFGLIFNELASNAFKHGAWSSSEGKVELNWRVEHVKGAASKLYVCWQERGGPIPATHRAPGLGIVLIEKSLAGAQVSNAYEALGLTCTIELELVPQEFSEPNLI